MQSITRMQRIKRGYQRGLLSEVRWRPWRYSRPALRRIDLQAVVLRFTFVESQESRNVNLSRKIQSA
jgi:hypothetical protein